MIMYSIKCGRADDPETYCENYMTPAELLKNFPVLESIASKQDINDGLFALTLISGLTRLQVDTI